MTLVLVRHAEPVAPGDPRYEENDRPLSNHGRRQAEALAGELARSSVAAIYSSPYPRAVETVKPLAALIEKRVSVEQDLRERLLAPGPLPDWLEHLRHSWADFSWRLPGGESSAEAQSRATRALDGIRERHVGERVVVASHGNLIALALHALLPKHVDAAFWAAMPMPAVYTIEPDGRVSGPGLGA